MPQLTTWPQLFVSVPHRPVHVVARSWGVQPQTFGVPPPPQVSVPEQVLPQSTARLQLSWTVPHQPAHVVAAPSERQTQRRPRRTASGQQR
jgi:hypothetical protein